MVTDNHFRWDFIGLSTDEKPTPTTSPKVVDGSTFYCSDNSKLYVWCKTQWYEKTVSGGGGTTYTAGDGIDITSDVISVDTTTIQPKLTAGSNITISDENVISASASAPTIKVLTTTDYNYPTENPNGVAVWLLPQGWYQKESSSVAVYLNNNTRDTSNSSTFYVGYPMTDTSATNTYIPFFYYLAGSATIHYDTLTADGGQSSLVNNILLNAKGINNNLTTTNLGYVLDARQGKALKDLIDALDVRVTALEG